MVGRPSRSHKLPQCKRFWVTRCGVEGSSRASAGLEAGVWKSLGKWRPGTYRWTLDGSVAGSEFHSSSEVVSDPTCKTRIGLLGCKLRVRKQRMSSSDRISCSSHRSAGMLLNGCNRSTKREAGTLLFLFVRIAFSSSVRRWCDGRRPGRRRCGLGTDSGQSPAQDEVFLDNFCRKARISRNRRNFHPVNHRAVLSFPHAESRVAATDEAK